MKFEHILKSILLILMTMSVLGCSDDPSKKLVIGIEDAYPPMSFRDDNDEIVGFDIDLAKITAEYLGREPVFKVIDWANKENELEAGSVDLIWSGLDINDERQEKMLFSRPYMNNQKIIIVQQDRYDIIDEMTLAGKIVGVQESSGTEKYFNTNDVLKNSLRELKTFQNYPLALTALSYGDIDAFVCDEVTGKYYVNERPSEFKILDQGVGSLTQFGIAFKKDNVELRDAVQEAFDKIQADGTAEKISNKWFGTDLIIK